MTLEAICYIGQTIAVFAIFVSLVIVILQQRNARQRAIDESADVMNSGLGGLRLRLGTEPELAELWLRGLFDTDSLSPLELFRFRLLAGQIFENTFILYRRHKRGTVSSEDWDRHAAFVRDGSDAPGIVKMWAARRDYYPDAFVAVMDELVKAPMKTDIYQGLGSKDAGT